MSEDQKPIEQNKPTNLVPPVRLVDPPAQPVEDEPKITHLMYMPHPADGDETTVAGVIFKAYEALELPKGKEWLGSHLANNPWFSANGDADTDRKGRWQKARDARKAADKAKAEAEAVEKEAGIK